MSETLRAIVIEDVDGKHKGSLKEITTDDPPYFDFLAHHTIECHRGLSVHVDHDATAYLAFENLSREFRHFRQRLRFSKSKNI